MDTQLDEEAESQAVHDKAGVSLQHVLKFQKKHFSLTT